MSSENTETSSGPSIEPVNLTRYNYREFPSLLRSDKEKDATRYHAFFALEKGKDFEKDPRWPELVFPLPPRDPRAESEEQDILDCIYLLNQSAHGQLFGQAAQALLEMESDVIADILLAQEGRWAWVQEWMQLFDKVLHLQGMEEDPVAQEVCASVLKKLEGLADKAPADVPKVIRAQATYSEKFAPAISKKSKSVKFEETDRESYFCKGVNSVIKRRQQKEGVGEEEERRKEYEKALYDKKYEETMKALEPQRRRDMEILEEYNRQLRQAK